MSWATHIYLLLLAYWVFSFSVYVSGTQDTLRLVTDLMDGYSKNVRPVKNGSESVTVKFGMAIQQLIDLDERNQILTTNMWLRQHWTDSNLVWDPKDYGNVSKIRLPSPQIWKPDIVLYNNAAEFFAGIMKTQAEIDPDGYVTWYAPTIFKSSCKIDIKYFPYDEQHCELEFGSWTFPIASLNLVNRSLAGDTGAYILNGEWKLLGFPVKRELIYYPCCPDDPYSVLTFTISIRRRSMYYVSSLLVPCILVSAMTMLTFLLPSDAGEKIGLSATILLSLTVFLLLMMQIMPPTSEVIPLIAQYFLLTLILVSISILMTTVVLRLHHLGGYSFRAPAFFRDSVFFLGHLLCMRCHCKKRSDEGQLMNGGEIDQSLPELNTNVFESSYQKQVLPPDYDDATARQAAAESGLGVRGQLQAKLRGLASYLQFIVDKVHDQELDEEIIKEWKDIAEIFDRLFMWIFGVTTIIYTSAIILQAPNRE